MQTRRGFTLVEVLVTVAIIGLLIALTLPALQAVRESSRRLECQSRLKQIGLALANYQTALGVYPFGAGGGGPPGRAPRWSSQSQILPYLEQNALFNALNFSGVPWGHDETFSSMNQTVLATKVEAFLCPSDGDSIEEHYGLAHNNYRASAGTLPLNLAENSQSYNTGAFWYQSAVGPSLIFDGSSSTALFSERCLGDSTGPDPLGDILMIPSADKVCGRTGVGEFPRFQSFVEWSGQRWGDGNAFYTRYHHILTPNKASCMYGQEDDQGMLIVTATSRHRGGVNLLTADGAVRFVKDAIDPAVWRALGTIAGGEIVNDSAY